MSGARGHVLVISSGYEPLNHVSGTRALHMARELTRLDWDVSVLCVDWALPGAPSPRSVDRSVGRALADPSPRCVAIDARLSNPDFDPQAVPPTPEPAAPRSVPLRKLRTLRNSLSWGQFGGWARNAAAAAALLHSRRPIDVAWAIHGDDSCHEIARRLRRRLGVPWVADFKDPWSFGYSPAAVRLQRRVTARRLGTAAACTETCATQADADRHDFGLPVHVIYSGYDADRMAAADPEAPGAGFSITYLGSIGAPHDVRLLPGVFRELDRRGGTTGVRIHQYARTVGQLRGLLEPVGCGGLVEDHDRVPRDRAFSLMRGSDVLLVFPMTRTAGKFVGLKELESMASGTPVLVLGEPLAELHPVIAASPQVRVVRDAAEGANFLEAEARQLRERGRSTTRGPVNGAALNRFTWPAQAEQLSAVLVRCRRAPGPVRHEEERPNP